MIKQVFQDSFVYGVVSILSRGISMFTLPFYARVLTPADFGTIDILFTFGALISLSVAFEIHQALIRFYSDLYLLEDKSRYAGTAWWFSVGMYLLFILGCLLSAKEITNALLGDGRLLIAFRLSVLLIASNGLFYFLQCQLRTEFRSRENALISLLYSILTMIFSVGLACVFSFGLEGVLLGQLIASLIAVLAAFLMVRRSFGFNFDTSCLFKMLTFSAPLVPAGIATFFSIYSNRLVLNSLTSLDDVGIFGIGAKIAGIAGLMMVGIQSALTPLIYNHYQKSETPANLAKLFEWFVAVSLLVCLGLGLFATELLRIFTTPQYFVAAPIVMLLAPAALLNQMYVFAPGIAIAKKMHWQIWISLVVAAVSILLNLTLIPSSGYVGAAWATLISGGLFAMLYFIVSQRFYLIPFRWKRIFFSVLLTIGMAYLGNFIAGSLVIKAATIVVVFGGILYFGLISRDDLTACYGALRSVVKN